MQTLLLSARPYTETVVLVYYKFRLSVPPIAIGREADENSVAAGSHRTQSHIYLENSKHAGHPPSKDCPTLWRANLPFGECPDWLPLMSYTI